MKNNFIFTVYLQPGARKSEIAGLHDGHIKIRIKAPPIDGKANSALIDFLSAFLEVPKSSVSILSGEKSRLKKVSIANLSIAEQEKLNIMLSST